MSAKAVSPVAASTVQPEKPRLPALRVDASRSSSLDDSGSIFENCSPDSLLGSLKPFMAANDSNNAERCVGFKGASENDYRFKEIGGVSATTGLTAEYKLSDDDKTLSPP